MRRAYMLVITRHQFVTGSRDAREADSNKLRGHDPRVGRFGGRRLQDGDRFEGELELLRCENICPLRRFVLKCVVLSTLK